MHEKTLATLEYSKIIERLVDEASFSASKELARALVPSDDPAEVERRLAYTAEARRLIELRPDAGVRGARDIRPQVAAANRGAILCRRTCWTCWRRCAPASTSPDHAQAGRAPSRCSARWGATCRSVRSSKGASARASARMARARYRLARAAQMRAEIRIAQQRLQERLGTLVNEFRGALQEALITMRVGRYVLPVKRGGARAGARGIVHDQSVERGDGVCRAAGHRRDEQPLRELEAGGAATRSSAFCARSPKRSPPTRTT